MQKLGVFCDVRISFDTSITDSFNHLDAVVTTINTTDTVQSTCEQTVFCTFQAVIHRLSKLSDFEVNADR
jgi:hypothetical protein